MIDVNNLPDELEVFLRKNDAIEAYRQNVNRFCNESSLSEDPHEWIDYPFTWSKTLQGVDYWNSLASKWSDYYDSVCEGTNIY